MKKTAKLIAKVLVVLMIVTLFAGCATAAETSATKAPDSAATVPGADTGKKVLGFLPSAMTSNFFQYTAKGAQAVAEANGYELLIQSPPSEDDYNAAVSIFEDMITQGVKGIMLCTNSQESLAPAIKKANEAGIPVVLFNTTTQMDEKFEVDVYAYCGYDQYAGCALIADWLDTYTNSSAKIGVIEGLPSYYTIERAGGFVDRVAQAYPGLEIVATQAGDWETEKAMNAAMDIIQAHPEVTVLYTLSDPMAQGAWAACEQLGRTDIIVTGVDGNPDVLQSIADGKITATLNANPVGMGANAAQALLDAIAGIERSDKIFLSETNVIDPSNVKDFLEE